MTSKKPQIHAFHMITTWFNVFHRCYITSNNLVRTERTVWDQSPLLQEEDGEIVFRKACFVPKIFPKHCNMGTRRMVDIGKCLSKKGLWHVIVRNSAMSGWKLTIFKNCFWKCLSWLVCIKSQSMLRTDILKRNPLNCAIRNNELDSFSFLEPLHTAEVSFVSIASNACHLPRTPIISIMHFSLCAIKYTVQMGRKLHPKLTWVIPLFSAFPFCVRPVGLQDPQRSPHTFCKNNNAYFHEN